VKPRPVEARPVESMALGLCTFNRSRAIIPTLRAIAAMDRAGGRITRLVVIDNNSTDDTADAIDQFIALNPDLPTRRIFEPRQGLAIARRRVFAETHEPLVGMLDDDCLPDHGWGQASLAVLDARPRAGAVGGIVEPAWEAGPTRLARRWAGMLAAQDLGPAARRLDGPIEGLVGAAVAFRRAALAESGWLTGASLVGRQGAALSSGEDAEMCVKLRLAGWEVWYDPAPRCQHLIPARRQTPEYLVRLRGAISEGEPVIEWLAARQPGPEWVAQRLARARRSLARTRLLEWRPWRRPMRLAQRRGRVQGWEALAARMRT
jgi:GT2 family glycosyltransferase